jgi:hypothetical protein
MRKAIISFVVAVSPPGLEEHGCRWMDFHEI